MFTDSRRRNGEPCLAIEKRQTAFGASWSVICHYLDGSPLTTPAASRIRFAIVSGCEISDT